ncbi:MAG TPA: methyl-accepting chemotaxis protein [Rhodocyclaceae bacterium]
MNFCNLRIIGKISAILTICAIGMLAGLILLLLHTRSEMYEAKALEAREFVRQAMAVLQVNQRLAQEGKIPEAEAKQRAIDVIAQMRHGDNDYFWLQDAQAHVVMHPIKPELNGKDMSDFKDPSGQKIFVEFARLAGQPSGGDLSYVWPKPGKSEPQGKVAHVELFAPWGWVVGTGVYTNDVEAAFRSQAVAEGGGMLAFMLLTGILLFVVTQRYICKPMEALQALMHQVESQRDLTLRTGYDSHDEVGRAGRSFDQLMDYMRTSFETIGVNAQSVASASEQLAAASSQVRKSSEEQAESAASMSAAVEQMTVSICHVTENTQQVRELGERSYQQENEGAVSVTHLDTELSHVQQAVGRMEVTMQEFMSSTQAISNLTQQVRDISEQTNLLALNAAIEAARAGEHGRGFAVVADEVRKLAEKSAKSAAEIDEVTRSVSEKTGTVEAAMEEGTDRLSKARKLMQHVTEVLHEAEEAVIETRGGLNDISSALTEQSAATNTIAQSVEHIAVMAEENTAAATQTADSAQQLRALSNELKSVIERFRIR